MNPPFLPFSKPSISQAALDEVIACLQSGWITTGPRVKQFESKLSAYLQAPHVLALTSGTAGLQLALQALDLQPGDEVITTAMTFVASLNTIVLAGAKPVLVDIDETYNLDVRLLEKAITPKTKAIMPVHFTGLPADLTPLYQLAKKYSLRVIEDAAQAIGSHYDGKIIGSFGDIQVFSFHPNKNMTTGEGGCVVTRDERLAKKITILRFHGIDRDAFNRFSKEGSQLYDVVAPGYKYNMLDMQAALGLHQLDDLESFIQKRTHLAARYYDLLGAVKEISLPKMPHYAFKHNWHLFTILINPEHTDLSRDAFIQAMKEKNIGTGLHYQPPHLFTYYKNQFGFKEGDFPMAEKVGNYIVSLPLFPDMTEQQQDSVIVAIKTIFCNRLGRSQ